MDTFYGLLSDEEKRIIYDLSQKYISLLAEGATLQELVAAASDALQNPVYILDQSFKALAYASSVDTDYNEWVQLVQKGYVSPERVERTIRRKLVGLVNASKKPVLINEYASEGIAPTIVAKIEVHNAIVGSISALECNQPFKPLDIRIIALTRDIAAVVMRKDPTIIDAQSDLRDYFVQNILEGKITDPREINERMKYINMKILDSFYVITVFIDASDQMNAPYKYYIEQIKRLLPDCRAVVHNGNIALVVSRNHDFCENKFSALGPYLCKHNMCGIVSNRLSGLNEIGKGYSQTHKVYEIVKQQQSSSGIYYFRDYVLPYAFFTISNKLDLLDLCHPYLMYLDEYDKARNTEYVDSLFAFLKFNRHITPTADFLYVHKNTISYRMEKISQLVNIDWDDGEMLFHIFFSIKILKFLKAQEAE